MPSTSDPHASAGTPLDELLSSQRLTIAQAITVMRAICRALARAHEQGLVHGHLWPHTVLVSPSLAEVQLTGLGAAQTMNLTGTLSTGSLNLGAFRYLAPEQIEPRPGAPAPDHRADIYSAGVIFHQMLTGRAPGEKLSLPSQLNSELPPEADALVLKCLSRNPIERYASTIDLLADLAKLEEASRLRLLTELRGIAQAGSGRRPLIIAGIVLLVVVLAVIVFLVKR